VARAPSPAIPAAQLSQSISLSRHEPQEQTKMEQKTVGIPAGLLHIAETIPSRAVAKSEAQSHGKAETR
jgi:hypothetical protein